LQVGVVRAPEQAAALLAQHPMSMRSRPTTDSSRSSLKNGVQDFSFIASQLIAGGFQVNLLREEEVNLETAFMRLTKGMVQ
jgi:ABC-2 type transport system ATP-binding protein